MAKPIKAPDLSAAVVFDTNPLFTENETELVASDCAKELVEIRATPGIQLILPRVVAGEILFRKSWGLTILHNEAEKKLLSIGRLVGTSQPALSGTAAMRRSLQRRFVKWCREYGVTLWRVPFDKVNWRRLGAAAITRTPPFSPFEPKGKSEKGFRDSLILETLCDVHAVFASKPIVFICGDGLLAKAAADRLGNDRLVVYKSTAEYLSYLKLQRQHFVKEVIKGLLEEATSTFYRANSPECVYTKFNIPHAIHAALPAEFVKLPSSSISPITLIAETFTASTAEGVRLGATNIEKAEDDDIVFRTDVAVGQAFQSSNQFLPEQLRVINTAVIWKATWHVLAEIPLSSPRLVSIQAEKTAFELATDDQLKSFNLPTLLDRALASLKIGTPGTERVD